MSQPTKVKECHECRGGVALDLRNKEWVWLDYEGQLLYFCCTECADLWASRRRR